VEFFFDFFFFFSRLWCVVLFCHVVFFFDFVLIIVWELVELFFWLFDIRGFALLGCLFAWFCMGLLV